MDDSNYYFELEKRPMATGKVHMCEFVSKSDLYLIAMTLAVEKSSKECSYFYRFLNQKAFGILSNEVRTSY